MKISIGTIIAILTLLAGLAGTGIKIYVDMDRRVANLEYSLQNTRNRVWAIIHPDDPDAGYWLKP